MALTRVSPALFQVSNNITSVTVGGSANTISLTFDASGVITSASNNAISVANTAITGNIISSQIASVNGSVITANTVANSAFQTGAVENYIASTGRTLTNRNLIINGAMQIAQRNTSVTGITTGDYRTADRWYFYVSSTGTWTMNVESSAPTNTEFRNSSNVICTTADSSLSAGDELAIIQNIEGFNCQGIKKGTANAESITVSFWVKSSNTGTFICELRDEDNSRQISKTYTINAANTWEKETITFPPDTTGAFDNDNNSSLRLFMWLAAGSNFTSGTLNSTAWASSVNTNRVVGQLNLANRVGNYLAITGVQLETGTVATPFEIRPYGTELALCQRYAVVFNGADSNSANRIGFGLATSATKAYCLINHPVTMRAKASLTNSATIAVSDASNGTATTSLAVQSIVSDTNHTGIDITVASGLTSFRPYFLEFNGASGVLTLSAEL
jgi:hypothetical protein